MYRPLKTLRRCGYSWVSSLVLKLIALHGYPDIAQLYVISGLLDSCVTSFLPRWWPSSGFTVLVWDHLITFVDEVELVWRGKKGLLVYLFLLGNRYLTPLGFIVNLVAHLRNSCQHFVRYEGAMTNIGIQVAGLMMFLRVRAIYNKKKEVVWSVMLLFLVWVGVTCLAAHARASMIFDPSVSDVTILRIHVVLANHPGNRSKVASASAWLPCLYDTYVFALILKKTITVLRKEEAGHVARTLLADAMLYYGIICAVNLVLALMIVYAPKGLKNITAQLTVIDLLRLHIFLVLTHYQVAMMSRITINLKKQALHGPTDQGLSTGTIVYPSSRSRAGTQSSNRYLPNSLAFSHNPDLNREHIRLSTVFSTNVTPRSMSPAQ
ncbi:hypothetical protein BU15DRAFT_45116 [Melanogaster broomeanus]|nr:hypothetical protein BU15DRAFT_45116 [Melanogaster broomeanus]